MLALEAVAQDTGAVVTAGRGFVRAGQRRLMVAAGQVGQGQVVMDQAQCPRVAGRADGLPEVGDRIVGEPDLFSPRRRVRYGRGHGSLPRLNRIRGA